MPQDSFVQTILSSRPFKATASMSSAEFLCSIGKPEELFVVNYSAGTK
jgi:hypothetical protein